jgi:integrase
VATFLATARTHRLFPSCTSPFTPECAEARSPASSGATSTPAPSESRSAGPCNASGANPVEFGPKTRTRRRTVELDTGTVEALERWRRQLQRDGLPAGIDDWMFCNTTGRHLNPQSISQLFGRIVARTDVPRVRFHDLRHTHASVLIASGADVKVVSDRLGHAHPAFTMHTYQHLLPRMSADAADQFADLIAAAAR